MRLLPMRLFEELPPKEQRREESYGEVAEDEARGIPLAGQKDVVATDQAKQRGGNHGGVSRVRLEPASVRQSAAIDSLSLEGVVPGNVREALGDILARYREPVRTHLTIAEKLISCDAVMILTNQPAIC